KNDMLRNKFWTGLMDDRLKNASRHKYDSVRDFGELLREVRKIEMELTGSAKLKRNAQHHASTAENSNFAEKLSEIASNMKNLVQRIDTLEQKIENNPSSSGQNAQFYPNGRGRGNFYPRRGGRRPQQKQDLN
ncbi:MAG: hypothetical protein N0C90_00560, partial [Candidatus Thiodiazotropha endolucinida]|nr:hypothetical protein [Candidatus Thiodiazotropha taylori]MCW4259837.1 hypothetical protein [Candidatus Thiodiazotropha endolucinida]